MQFRTATLSELDAVYELVLRLAESQRAMASRLDLKDNPLSLRLHLARQLVDDGVIIALDGAQLIGVVTFHRLDDSLGRTESIGLIEHLFVDADHRDRGIGGTLLEHAEQALIDRGVSIVELEVMAVNTDAWRFYETRGYRPHRIRLSKRVGGDQSEW